MSAPLSNPFPGLRSFDYKEHHLFFGREKNIKDLLRKLEQNHFVAIVGTSGTGKSSLIRAGLLPAIHSGKFGSPTDEWLIASMKPGSSPIKNLANSLLEPGVFFTGDVEKDNSFYSDTITFLSQSSLGLIQSVRAKMTGNKKLLILVDQFEEIFRFTDEDPEKKNIESNAFVKLIIDSVRQRDIPIYVILTLRSDFLGDCIRFEGLPEAINDGHYLVPRLTIEQSKSAVTSPVDYAKGKISPRLVQRVINDLGDNPDQLPILQHALMRTWDCWTKSSEPGDPMDIGHYELIGSMTESLSNHADEAYIELKNENQKKLIEQIFKCLTVKTGDNRGIRRPTSVQNILNITGTSLEELRDTLHPFRKAGRTFILPYEEVEISSSSILDISHESLMRGWERLRIWVDEEMESAEIYQRLCKGALLNREGRAGLWRDPELQLAIDWKRKNNPNEPWSKQYNNHFAEAMNFLEASIRERSNEMRSKKKRRTVTKVSVISFLIVVSVLTTWALFQTKTATEKSKIAEEKTTEAINQKQQAEKAKEMALDASKQAMDAKSFAELQSNIAGEQKKIAETQKSKAEQEAINALTQKQIAEAKGSEALKEKQKADSAQSEAMRLRLLSLSQNIAFKSIQIKNDGQLSALLAYESYKLTRNNQGNVNDYQLYAAAYNASAKISSDFKDIKIRENSEVKSMMANSKQVINVLENGTIAKYDGNDCRKINTTTLPGLQNNLNTAYINKNGNIILAGNDMNVAFVWDLSNISQPPQQLTGHQGLIRTAAFSEDGSIIATGGRDSTVIIWQNSKSQNSIKFSSRIRALSFLGDKNNLLVGDEEGSVFLCNTLSGDKHLFANDKGARVQCVDCSRDGRTIAVAYSDGNIQVLNNKGVLLKTLSETGSADFVRIDEKENILVTASSRPLIHIYELNNLQQKPIEISVLNKTITSLTVASPFIYVACSDNTIRNYPIRTTFFEKILTENIKRSLTAEEWNTYIGSDVPYEK